MAVLETLRDTLSTSRPSTYECRLCATRFQDRPLNCPACGSTAIEET